MSDAYLQSLFSRGSLPKLRAPIDLLTSVKKCTGLKAGDLGEQGGSYKVLLAFYIIFSLENICERDICSRQVRSS